MPVLKDYAETPLMYGCPSDIVVQERFVEETVDKTGTKITRVFYKPKKLSDISKEVLDPDVVNASSLITQGLTIPVENMQHILDKTDVQSIDAAREKYVGDALDYIEAHKEELFPEKK